MSVCGTPSRPSNASRLKLGWSCVIGRRNARSAPQAEKPVLLLARRNEPPNQILDSYDPAKTFLSVHDSSKSQSGSAQLLHNPISGLIFGGGYDAPDMIVQRFVSILIEQDIEDVNQT